MTTLYYCKKLGDNGQLCRLSRIPLNMCENIIYGSPITLEYKRIKLVSNKLDIFGKSEIMVVNHIKTIQKKETAMESITYYDKNAVSQRRGLFKRKYEIDNFNPAEYGNPVCYYNPSYQDNVINMCTKFYELDGKFNRPFKNLFGLGEKIPNYGMYFSVANKMIDGVSELTYRFGGKRLLVPDHIIQFRTDEPCAPFVTGKYVCFPDSIDQEYITGNYNLVDDEVVDEKNVEYDGSYFILKVSNKSRPDLLNFDFVASSNELLSELRSDSVSAMAQYSDLSKKSFDFDTIQDIINAHKIGELAKAKATFLQLQENNKNWFIEHFSAIYKDLKV